MILLMHAFKVESIWVNFVRQLTRTYNKSDLQLSEIIR